MNTNRKRSFNIIRKTVALAILVLSVSVLCAPTLITAASEITKIDATTFRGNTDISTIHIGSNVTEISSGSFRGLLNLRSITVSEKNPYFSSYSNCLYNKNMTELLCYPPALSGALIPESVVSVGENALHGVPENIKSQIRDLVSTQASGGSPRQTEKGTEASGKTKEADDPGPRLIHTEDGIKWKSGNGTVKNPDSELMLLVADLVGKCTTADMTKAEQLQSCFDYFVAVSSYEKRIDVPLGNWSSGYAVEILRTGKGGMYNFAAAFAYIAKGLGYDARVCSGAVETTDGMRSGRAWTEVKIGRDWYVFDTQRQKVTGQSYYQQTYANYPDGYLKSDGSITVTFE